MTRCLPIYFSPHPHVGHTVTFPAVTVVNLPVPLNFTVSCGQSESDCLTGGQIE